jgi:hypothetical protein
MGWGERQDKPYRDCMAELIGVLKKYDMAGAMLIVSKERSMWKYHFPTWGVVSLVESGSQLGIQFKSKREDFPSLEAQKEAVTLSTHVIYQLRDLGALTFKSMDGVCGMLEQHFEIEHKGGQDFDPELSN